MNDSSERECAAAEIHGMQALIERQRAAYAADPYPSAATRIDRINRLIALLVREQTRLCEALADDFGRRSFDNSRMFDILPPINALKYARKHVSRWMKGERRRANFPYGLLGARAHVQFIPLGVVGNISPWNFPLTLALSPMGGILAAGNRVMIKPSELTPATSELLGELIAQDFDDVEIAVVTGDASVAAQFSKLPFDHLVFTGSTSVARLIALSAAPGLVPTTLELGGKSPVIVGASANLLEVAKKVLFAKTMNAGQICLAPDYLMIHPSQKSRLIEAFRDVVTELYPAGAASKDYVNIISERHAKRLNGYLHDARARGNNVIPLFESKGIDDPRCIVPHVIDIVGEGGSVMEEEIFGPILPILAVDSIESMAQRVRGGPRPLALYYFGNDRREIQFLSSCVAVGGMVVNDLLLHFLQDDLPFGGIGDSGNGSYHGEEGFRRFSHTKAVFTQSRFDLGKLLRPPYGERFRALLDFEIRN
jgi:coniferyl-aldehyde dehydrogenase